MDSAKYTMTKHFFVALLIGAALFALGWHDSRDKSREFPDGYEIAVWEWRSPRDFNANEREEFFNELRKHKVNTVYLNIEDYLNIVEGPEGRREREMSRFFTSLGQFLSEAAEKGIEVEALAGAQEWILSSHNYIPARLLDFVLTYNSTHEHGFSGIQFDIEYYNLSSHRANARERTLAFLALAENLTEKLDEDLSGIRLGFAIPYWFVDETNRSTPVAYSGETRFPGEHLLDILDRYDNSYVAVMAYRDEAGGRGGTIDILENTVAYIEDNNYGVKVVVGQETSDVEPARITHYNRTRQHLKLSVAEVLSAYADDTSVTGAAIHHAESFLEMSEYDDSS